MSYLFICLFIYLFVCLSVCLSLFVCLFIAHIRLAESAGFWRPPTTTRRSGGKAIAPWCFPLGLSAFCFHPPPTIIYLSFCLSTYLFIYSFIYLFLYLFVCLFIYYFYFPSRIGGVLATCSDDQ